MLEKALKRAGQIWFKATYSKIIKSVGFIIFISVGMWGCKNNNNDGAKTNL